MKKIKVIVALGTHREEDEFEVDDNTTDVDIDILAKEFAFDRIDWWWENENDEDE